MGNGGTCVERHLLGLRRLRKRRDIRRDIRLIVWGEKGFRIVEVVWWKFDQGIDVHEPRMEVAGRSRSRSLGNR
jgi:hypothetical protein